MRRMLIVVLAVCMILACHPICQAERAIIDSFFVTDTNGQHEDYIISTALFHGDLYMLSNQKLYRYSLDNREKQTIIDWSKILSDLNHGQSRDEWLDDFSRTRVHSLIAAKDAIYGVNERYGTIFRLENNKFVFDAQIDPERAEIANAFGRIYQTDGHLYYTIHSPKDETDMLCDYDMTHQMFNCYDAGCVYEIAMVDGQIALLRESEDAGNALEIALMDMETRSFSTLALFEDRNISGICDVQENERLLYLQEDRIFELKGQGKDSCLGFIPLRASSLQYEVLLLSNDTAALISPSGIYIRGITKEEPSDHILRMCLYDTPYLPSFIASNPDIHLSVTNALEMRTEELIHQLLDGTLEQDVIEVDASSLFQVMAEKGYLADLAGSSIIMTEWEQLYPFIQKAIAQDGKILGIPSRLRVETWAYQEEMWKSILPDLNTPQNFDELMALCWRWIDDMTEGNEDYCLIYPKSVFIEALSMDLFQMYIEQFDQADSELSFDTDTFRHIFEELAELKEGCRNIANHVSVEEEENLPLLISNYNAFLKKDEFSFMNDWTPILPVLLEHQQYPVVNAKMTVYILNAASEHQQEALRFLEFVVENRTYADERLIKASVNTPVERKGFEEECAALRDHIDYLYSQLEVCDESAKKEIQTTIAYQEELLEKSQDNKWLISEEEIKQYRELACYIHIRQTALSEAQINSETHILHDVFWRYVEGNIELSTCIHMLNERLNMILKE